MTPGQRRVDLRHAMIAALKTASGQRVFYDADLVGASAEGFFQNLFMQLKDHTLNQISAAKRDVSDTTPGVDSVFAELKFLPEAAPPQQSELHYVADAPVETLADDRLGIATEVLVGGQLLRCVDERLAKSNHSFRVGKPFGRGYGRTAARQLAAFAQDDTPVR